MAEGRHSTKKWLVIGHYGGHNIGDEAMLSGLILGTHPHLRQRLVVASRATSLPKVITDFGVELVPVTIACVFSQIKSCQGVVLGGGTHFHDDYGTLRYLRHCRYMARIVAITLIAKALRKRTLWLSMGFGPFLRRPTAWIASLGAAACDGLTVRDTASQEEMATHLPHHNGLRVGFDVATLLATGPSEASPEAKQPQGKRVLGISCTSLERSATARGVRDDVFWGYLADAVTETLEKQLDVIVRIFIFRGGSREDDSEVSNLLYRRIKKSHPSRVELVPYQPDPFQTMREIRTCHTFIATRFHSALMAYLAGCNLMTLVYHRKVADLAQELGLSSSACIDPRVPISARMLSQRITDLVEGNPAYRPELPLDLAIGRARVSIEVLETLDSSR